jgi:hypothetical protein
MGAGVMLIVIIMVWIAFGLIPGYIAQSRGHSFFLFFLLGFLVSPLIAIIVALVIPRGEGQQSRRRVPASRGGREPRQSSSRGRRTTSRDPRSARRRRR